MNGSLLRRAALVGGLAPLAAGAAGAVALETAALTLTATSAEAQTTSANLRGYITGTGGSPVPNAQVTTRLIETNQLRTTTTNEAGFYYLAGLRPGQYEVSVRRIGVQPITRALRLPIGETVDLNLTTTEATAQLSAVVVTTDRGRETRTSEVSTNISREQIQNLPNFERNVLDLARLAPGMTAQDPTSTDKVLSAGGQPPEAINIFVDGASYKNDVLRGGVVGQDASKGNPLPQGAIQEFRVLTQNYKAEYQRAASAIIVATTRSGTNQSQADLFAYGVGKAYVARDAFTAEHGGARPNYQRLQAGGNIGGPIVRDKLFYFGTYELNFRDEPAYIRFSGDSGNAPIALRNQLRPYLGQQAQQFREHLGLGKLTWNASEQNTLDVSTTIRHDDDFRGFGGTTSFESAENLKINTYTSVANFKHAGSKYLNEAQLSSQFFTWEPVAKNFNTIGRDYAGLLRIGGKDTKQDFQQNRVTLRDDITRAGVRLGGDHVFKGGASVDLLSYSGTKYFVGNPIFFYRADTNPQYNYNYPQEAQFGFGNPTIKTNNTQIGAYIQDDWSVGRRLVLNLGIRWDGETNMINNNYVTPQPLADSLRGPLNAQLYRTQPLPNGTTRQVRVIDELGGLNRFITTGRADRPMYKKAFQPRLGASYDLGGDGRTVVFGGGGLYYDRNYWNTLFDEQFRRQYRVLDVQFRASCGAGSPANCAVFDPKYYDPAQLRTLSGSAGVPEVFLVANDLTPPSTTQMSAGIRQAIGNEQLTVSYNGLRGRNYMNFVAASPYGGVGPNYATVFVTDDRVKTWYNALQVQIERPLRPDIRFGGAIAYTLGRSEEQGQSTDLFWGFDDRYPTVADRPRLRAPGDQRHAVVANAIVRLPYDLRLSTIGTFGSGIAQNATNASAGWGQYQQYTYTFTPATRPFLGLGHVFATQAIDFRLEKGISLLSGQRVAILADVFNAFNTANYSCYATTINPPDPAHPTVNTNANYGQPGCAGLGRRLQVGLRYGFEPNVSTMSR
jgi:hypothetical protein